MVYIEIICHGKGNLKIIIIAMVQLLKNMLNTMKMVKKRLLVSLLIIKKVVHGQSGLKMVHKNIVETI